MNNLNGWLRVLRDIGFPAAVVLILFGFYSGYISSPLTMMEKTLHEHKSSADRAIQELARSRERNAKLLEMICRNTARSEFQRDLCSAE